MKNQVHTFEEYLSLEFINRVNTEADSIIDMLEKDNKLPENNEEMNSLSFIQKVYAYRDFLRMARNEDEGRML